MQYKPTLLDQLINAVEAHEGVSPIFRSQIDFEFVDDSFKSCISNGSKKHIIEFDFG